MPCRDLPEGLEFIGAFTDYIFGFFLSSKAIKLQKKDFCGITDGTVTRFKSLNDQTASFSEGTQEAAAG
jgi:hypothetical protein